MQNFIRPIKESDLDVLYKMATESGVGVTSLPANKQQMQDKLSRAIKSFEQNSAREDGLYLFALENSDSEAVIGISALESRIGHQDVWYNYRVGNTVSASRELGVHKETPTLFLSNDLTGASELCTLYLSAEFRNGFNGKLLSKSRYLFLAEFSHLFSERVIAEMRGYSDDQGKSPFWESLGKVFFNLEFSDADYLTGLGDKAFIAELMPKYPIYTPFLSEQAQGVIGKVHPQTEPALAMLKSEGFKENKYVDIFDGGPSVECELSNIRAVSHSKIFEAVISETAQEGELKDYKQWLVCNRKFQEFRVVLVSAPSVTAEQIHLTPSQAELLMVDDHDSLRAVALKPEPIK